MRAVVWIVAVAEAAVLARSGECRSAGDVRKCVVVGAETTGKRAVVAGGADSCGWSPIVPPKGRARQWCDRYEKTIFVAPLGLRDRHAAGCVAPFGSPKLRRLRFHRQPLPCAGPALADAVKFVSSYWRGRSLPVFPSLMARYSLPKRVVEFA